MPSSPEPVIQVTRHFPFPSERVFDAWLEPAVASKWLFATPTGQMIRAEIDPRAGGRFVFTDRRDAGDIEHTGEYLEIDRPRRLVFNFGVPKYSPDFACVEIEIVPQDEGCRLTLTQHDTKPEYASRTKLGWTQILERAAALLGDETPDCHIAR